MPKALITACRGLGALSVTGRAQLHTCGGIVAAYSCFARSLVEVPRWSASSEW